MLLRGRRHRFYMKCSSNIWCDPWTHVSCTKTPFIFSIVSDMEQRKLVARLGIISSKRCTINILGQLILLAANKATIRRRLSVVAIVKGLRKPTGLTSRSLANPTETFHWLQSLYCVIPVNSFVYLDRFDRCSLVLLSIHHGSSKKLVVIQPQNWNARLEWKFQWKYQVSRVYSRFSRRISFPMHNNSLSFFSSFLFPSYKQLSEYCSGFVSILWR